jgi:hypothetical protein
MTRRRPTARSSLHNAASSTVTGWPIIAFVALVAGLYKLLDLLL